MEVREGYTSEQIRNEAFISILETLNNRQREVYNVIKKMGPISNEKIAEHLNLYPHKVTPRALELRDLGLVEFAGDSTSSTSKRKVSLWKINPNSQLNLFK